MELHEQTVAQDTIDEFNYLDAELKNARQKAVHFLRKSYATDDVKESKRYRSLYFGELTLIKSLERQIKGE